MTENDKALIQKEILDVKILFSKDGMDKILADVREQALSQVPDVSTEGGRKDIASMAFKVARSKTLIDELGKDMGSEWKKKIDRINGFRKQARDTLDALKDEVRKPLTDYEQEQKRIKEENDKKEKEIIQFRINSFIELGMPTPSYVEVAAMTDDEYTENLMVVTKAKEKRERIKAKEEAERKAENDRLALERAEIEMKQKEQADREAELKRQQDEIDAHKKAIEDEITQKREAEERAQREKEEAETLAKEQAEDKERQERLKLDKEKLTRWVNSIGQFMPVIPTDLDYEESREIITQVLSRLDKMFDEAYEMIKKL